MRNFGHNNLQADVSRETFEQLKHYFRILEKWQKHINLVSSQTQNWWTRHIEDSLQLRSFLPKTDSAIYDLGSGAGLPGMILAIAMPLNQFYLVESDQKKSIFLKEVKRELGLQNVSVISQRIEEINDKAVADVVVSRALAPLSQLLEYSQNILKKNAFCLFLKGKNYGTELAVASAKWHFECDIFPSLTAAEGRIIKLHQIRQLGH